MIAELSIKVNIMIYSMYKNVRLQFILVQNRKSFMLKLGMKLIVTGRI